MIGIRKGNTIGFGKGNAGGIEGGYLPFLASRSFLAFIDSRKR